jgi:hypothetical protein
MDQKLMNSQSFPSDGAHSVSGHLNVLVEKSTGVPTKHHDFYVSLKLTKFESEKASSVRHTKLASGACPQWNEEFVFLVEDRNHQTLLLNLMAKKALKDVEVAKFVQNLGNLADNIQQEFVYSDEGTSTSLFVKVMFQPSQLQNKKEKKLIKLPNFRIELSKLHFLPGEMLDGKVVYSNQKAKTIRGVRLRIHGYEHVYWTERHGKVTVTYTQDRWYMKTLMTLFGFPKAQKGKLTLEPGLHEWPFKIQIPVNAPPSFSHIRGKVLYVFHAYIDIPHTFDKTASINFFVYLPAERIPNKLREAVEYQVSDHKNLIHAKAVIPKTVWIAEEVIEIFLDIKNDSEDEINKMDIKLKEHAEYHATTNTSHLLFARSKGHMDSLHLKCGTNWSQKILLKIPKVEPTLNKDISQIIFNEYFVSITLRYHVLTALKIRIPIFIWRPIPALNITPTRIVSSSK